MFLQEVNGIHFGSVILPRAFLSFFQRLYQIRNKSDAQSLVSRQQAVIG